MTEAEKALIAAMLANEESFISGDIAKLVSRVRTERLPPGAKRAYMDAVKVRERALRACRAAVENLGLPPGLDLSLWRNEAFAELEDE